MFSNDLKKKVIEEIVLNSSSKLDDAFLIENTLKIFKVKKKDLVRASNYFFPNGLQDVIFEYSNLNNLKFRKEIKNDEIKNLKIREKIFFLVMKRIRFNSIEISKNLTKSLAHWGHISWSSFLFMCAVNLCSYHDWFSTHIQDSLPALLALSCTPGLRFSSFC